MEQNKREIKLKLKEDELEVLKDSLSYMIEDGFEYQKRYEYLLKILVNLLSEKEE